MIWVWVLIWLLIGLNAYTNYVIREVLEHNKKLRRRATRILNLNVELLSQLGFDPESSPTKEEEKLH